MISFKVLFTPGRSGTAFLAQVFGLGEYTKRAMHLHDGQLVSHENLSSREIPVPYMKKHGVDDPRPSHAAPKAVHTPGD